jgi:hypothetical protein
MDRKRRYTLKEPVKTEETGRQCDVKTHVWIDEEGYAHLSSIYSFFPSEGTSEYTLLDKSTGLKKPNPIEHDRINWKVDF